MNDSAQKTSSTWLKTSYKAVIRKVIRSAAQVLEKGVDILVLLAMITIALLQVFPGTTFYSTLLEQVADLSNNKIFVLPILLFCISVSAKLFRSAKRFPVDHWAFFIGFGSGIAGIVALVMILITERIDAFWISGVLLSVWVVLELAGNRQDNITTAIKRQLYNLFIIGLFVVALSFPLIFDVKYELTSRIARDAVAALKAVKMPDNDPCFSTITRVDVNTLGFTYYAHEKYDEDCSAMSTALFMVDTGFKYGDAGVAATGLAALSNLSKTQKMAADEITKALGKMTQTGDEYCFKDKSYFFCMRPAAMSSSKM